MEYFLEFVLDTTVIISEVISVLMIGSTPVKSLKRQNGKYNLLNNK